MKRILAALAICAPLHAFAGTLTMACIGPNTPDCPVSIDATLKGEILVVRFYTGPVQPNGGFQRASKAWCDKSVAGWFESGWTSSGCYFTGTVRVLNGELTKRQLAEAGVQFEYRVEAAACGMVYEGPRCFNQGGTSTDWRIL